MLRYVSVASAVGAPTGRRLRGGCNVGSLGVGIQWWIGCPDSIARALCRHSLKKMNALFLRGLKKFVY